MADQGKSDILMQFVLNGNPVPAECVAQVDPKDTFMKGIFHPATGPDVTADYSDFFQVLKFDFGLSVKDGEKSGSKQSDASLGMHQNAREKPKEKSKSSQSFADWRKAAKGEMEEVPYKIDTDPISITRVIDAASPIFFQSCCYNVTFDKAIMVRRFAVSSTTDGKTVTTPMSFLRLTFEKVLITSVDWDDGDVLNETCKFICQKFKVEYKKQDADGILQLQTPADWDWVRDSDPNAKK